MVSMVMGNGQNIRIQRSNILRRRDQSREPLSLCFMERIRQIRIKQDSRPVFQVDLDTGLSQKFDLHRAYFRYGRVIS